MCMLLFTCCQHRTGSCSLLKSILENFGCFLVKMFLFISLFPPVISKLWKHLLGRFFFCEVILCKRSFRYSDVLWYLITPSIVQSWEFYLLSPGFFSTIVSIFVVINIFADALYEPQQHRAWQTRSLQFLCATVWRVERAENRAALSRGAGNVLVCRMLCPSVLHQNGIYSCFTGVCYKLYRKCSFCSYIRCLGKV